MAESSEKMPPYPDIFTDDFQMSDQVKYDILTKPWTTVHSFNFPVRASRTATRINTASEGSADESVNFGDHGHDQEKTNCPRVEDLKDIIQQKVSFDETLDGDAFPSIQGCSHSKLPHPNQLLQSRKRKKQSAIKEKEKGFPNINSHLHEVQSKFARTVNNTTRDDGQETPASNYSYLEYEVKENLPDYEKMAKTSTSISMRSSVSITKEHNALKNSTQMVNVEAVQSGNKPNTIENNGLKGINGPLETNVMNSWEEMEELIHKRWKSKHWLYLPQDSHLPEQ